MFQLSVKILFVLIISPLLFSFQANAQQNIQCEPEIGYEGYIEQGLEAFDSNIYTALDYLDCAIYLNPDGADAYVYRASAFFPLGQPDESLAGFEMALSIEPNHPAALVGRGFHNQIRGNYRQAVIDYEHALDLNPRPDQVVRHGIYLSLGICYDRLGEYSASLENFELALSETNVQNSALAQTYFYRGLVHQDMGNESLAEIDWNTAFELEPNILNIILSDVDGYLMVSSYEIAHLLVERVLDIDSDNFQAYFERGKINVAENNSDAAITDFERAIELNPNMVRAYYELGNIYADLDNPEVAIANYEQVISIIPTAYFAYVGRGNVLLSMGATAAAIDDYAHAVEIVPDYVEAYLGLGNAYYKQGNLESALMQYERYVSLAQHQRIEIPAEITERLDQLQDGE